MAPVSTLLVVAVLVAVVLVAPVQAALGCVLSIGVDNRERYVFGGVNTECGAWHSVPWGNWGVNGPYSSRQNGLQFAGWKNLDGHQQWNSCTDEYPPPDENYYNWGVDYTYQKTDIFDEIYTYGPAQFLQNLSCSNFQNHVVTVEEHSAHVYELDPFWPDQYIASAIYAEQSFTLSCSGSGTSATCDGMNSSWEDPSDAPDEFTAEARAWAHAQWGPDH